jgi:hypothetical protein
MSPALRKVLAEELKGIPVRGTAVINSSFQQRVLTTVIHNVVNFVTRNEQNPVCYCATEAEARAFIDARRKAVMHNGDR